MNTTTPSPAHVALVTEMCGAVNDCHAHLNAGGPKYEEAFARAISAQGALYLALAAPPPQQVPDSKAIQAALMNLPRFDYGYRSDEWGMGRSLGFITKADGPVVRFADVVSFLAAVQPTPAPGALHALCGKWGREDAAAEAQGMQPVETSRQVRDSAFEREYERDARPPMTEAKRQQATRDMISDMQGGIEG